MRSFLIYYKDDLGYKHDVVIRAFNQSEAVMKFYSEYPADYRITRID